MFFGSQYILPFNCDTEICSLFCIWDRMIPLVPKQIFLTSPSRALATPITATSEACQIWGRWKRESRQNKTNESSKWPWICEWWISAKDVGESRIQGKITSGIARITSSNSAGATWNPFTWAISYLILSQISFKFWAISYFLFWSQHTSRSPWSTPWDDQRGKGFPSRHNNQCLLCATCGGGIVMDLNQSDHFVVTGKQCDSYECCNVVFDI